MVVCAKALLNVARKLEGDWGVPFFEGSFYGITDTSQALRDFARLIGDPRPDARTEALIAREEAKSAPRSHPGVSASRASACCSTPAASSPGRSSPPCRIWA
jgi:nitrogenase molybdenum-cofactor synthesis protein NifE